MCAARHGRSMPIESIPEVLSEFAQLAFRVGAAPLNQHAGCWQVALDGHWHCAMNAHRDEHNGGPPGGMEFAVPPFTLAVWWNGWLAGTIDPSGGVIAAGSGANEGSLIAAMKAYRPAVSDAERDAEAVAAGDRALRLLDEFAAIVDPKAKA